MTSELERVRAEQQRCADYLAGTGDDKAGAIQGAKDWLLEESLILEEQSRRSYSAFLQDKLQDKTFGGFTPSWIPNTLFPFQHSVTDWLLRKGKAALFAECGMGKSWCELVWAENVVRHTNKPVLLLTMLGVAKQMIGEAEKVGVEARRSAGDLGSGAAIIVTNYEKLHHFSPHDFYRTMTKALAHKTIVEDSCDCARAGADYLLIFRRRGNNQIPVTHTHGLMRYAGERKIPHELLRYRGWAGDQIENRYSHWIWRQYASSVWDDIRGNTGRTTEDTEGVLPYREAREDDDEKHLHPLQLDVVERCVELWSNPGETVLSPFAGVGTEPYQAVRCGRKAIGIELKPSYFKQSLRNMAAVKFHDTSDQVGFEFQTESAIAE